MKIILFWALLLSFTWTGAVSLSENHVSSKGFHSKGLESRIINGHKAEKGQIPFQALIRSDGHEPWCGGSLINEKWILTAAHCVKGAENINIYLGSTLFYDINDASREEFLASKFYIHPKSDIALIKLSNSVTFNNNIKLISLPNMRVSPGSIVVASGWGKTRKAFYSNDLLYAHLKIASNEACSKNSVWPPGDLCAIGVHNENTCNGDSGGPLVYNATGTPFLVGVTSFGPAFNNCFSDIPDFFFTDVYAFKQWIKDTMNNH